MYIYTYKYIYIYIQYIYIYIYIYICFRRPRLFWARLCLLIVLNMLAWLCQFDKFRDRDPFVCHEAV